MNLGGSDSFGMDDHEGFNLDDDFLGDDDGADLGNIFEGDDDLLNDVSPSKHSLDITKLSPEIDGGKDNEKSSTGGNNARIKDEKGKDKGETQKGRKRRRPSLSASVASGANQVEWHNQAADRPHREAMFKEV